MGVPRGRSSGLLGSVRTSRYITITTAAAQSVVASSAISVVSVFNIGSGNLLWGDSNIAVNSGAIIYPGMSWNWENVEDVFTVYFRAESVATLIAVTEHGVP